MVKIVGLVTIDSEWLDAHPETKLIIKKGIGVDNFDLEECKKRGVIVCNTPDAPSNAVAELTIMQMINMLRKVQNVSEQVIKKEKWNRYIGRELKSCKVGVIGTGRTGTMVIYKLSDVMEVMPVLFNDIDAKKYPWFIMGELYFAEYEQIFKECDVITLHIPLKDKTIDNTNFITRKELDMMKPNVRLLNMSRGGIINEKDLYYWLKENKKACVALDSYCEEAYEGKLCELGNVYLTPHLGSCTETSKQAMLDEAEKIKKSFLETGKVWNRVI